MPPCRLGHRGWPTPCVEEGAGRFTLRVRAELKVACWFMQCGRGEKADRRPIDPPPIVRLRIRHAKPSAPGSGGPSGVPEFTCPTMAHSLFCFASLVSEHDDEDELYLMPGSQTSHVTGSVVSSLFHLKDQSCFVFPDLSVRTEGRWRFKMSMYEIVEDGVHFCKSLFTKPFQCYSSKRFPGMTGKPSSASRAQAPAPTTGTRSDSTSCYLDATSRVD